MDCWPNQRSNVSATDIASLPLAAEEQAFDRDTQNRRKQEAFLKAGTRCFNQKGFSGTSLDEIAEQLQVSKGAFYYHFANKEALLTQCFDYTLDQLEGIVAGVERLDVTPGSKLDIACRQIFALQNSDRGTAGPFQRHHRAAPSGQAATASPLSGRACHAGKGRDRRHRLRRIRDLPAGIVIQLLTGALNAAMDLGNWQPIDNIDLSAADYFSVFFQGLATTAPQQ